MQIKIGNILYIGGDSPFNLAPPVQGLESPAIRIGDGLYAGRDGGFVSGHFYGHRTIVLNGFYIGGDCDEASELRETLFGLLRIRYRHPISITTARGIFYTEGFVSDVKAEIENLVSGKFQISLVCPDPILYRILSTTEIESMYVTQNFTAGSPLTINNAGVVNVPPIIKWNGKIDDFSITNTETGEVFALDNNLPSGNTTVDFKKRLVLVDGECYNSHRTVDSVWWSLIPGENVLELTGTGVSGEISWAREARAGI